MYHLIYFIVVFVKNDFLLSVPTNSDFVVNDTDKNYSDSESFKTSRAHGNLCFGSEHFKALL